MDPRKAIHRPPEDQADILRDKVHEALIAATEYGTKQTGMSGASFVITGLGIWTSELAEVDARAVSQMLAALSVFYDPHSNDAQRAHANRKRNNAVNAFFASLDLKMAPPEGNG